MFADFFHQNNQIKMQYFDKNLGGARGYTPYKTETPKDGNHADLKEFWQMGRDLPLDHRYKKYMFDNFFASEIPEFETKIKELFSSFDQFGDQLMQAIALYLQLDIDHFKNSINYGNSVLRAIHYPPIASEESGERAGAHGDINLITLLIGGHKPGLEILFENKWVPINTVQNTVVCNIGDMLERYTNHLLPSVIHRVTSHSDQIMDSSRYSIPFFLHPNPDWLIETLPSCIDNDHPDLYPKSIIADDFLQQRLHEINLL
tara:strand:- start:463 stop:1242 length:780 start_codon:yes stop_codon:yes gene_type:complete